MIPAWNDTNAYSGNGGAGITVALYKRMSLNVSTLTHVPVDPPLASWKKNLFAAHDWCTYSLL